MIKSIVFDVGGVLIKTEDRSSRAALEKKFELSPGGVDELVFNSAIAKKSTLGLADEAQIWDNVAARLGLSPEALGEFQKTFWAGDFLDDCLVNFLESLRPEFTTALLTNAWSGARQMLAKEHEIFEGTTVDRILISSELGVAKPDYKIYHILAKTLGCKYSEILFVDDFMENITAADHLGIHTILYQTGMNLRLRIKEKIKRILN